MNSRIFPVIKKEFTHIRRDFRTLVIVILMPLLMLFLYGFAINMEIQNVDTIVLDHDKSPASRSLIQKFEGSRFFNLSYFDGPQSQLESFFSQRAARMILIIPKGFSKNTYLQPQTEVQVLIDASDSNAAQAIRNYSDAIFRLFSLESAAQPIFAIESAIWYNPGLKSAFFFVPGLAVLILIMISALLTSVAIVREKETGTMEQILVSPIRAFEIIIGKVVPYIFLAFVDLLIILLVANSVFDVPVAGSLTLLLFASLIFIFTALSLGLLISTRAQTQQVAMMIALMATMLPTVMLSGFIFPLNSLPKVLQLISYLVPARYFMTVIRGVMLKGNTFVQILPELSILTGLGFVLILISVKKFKTTIES